MRAVRYNASGFVFLPHDVLHDVDFLSGVSPPASSVGYERRHGARMKEGDAPVSQGTRRWHF